MAHFVVYGVFIIQIVVYSLIPDYVYGLVALGGDYYWQRKATGHETNNHR
jgi:hypothetical protein